MWVQLKRTPVMQEEVTPNEAYEHSEMLLYRAMVLEEGGQHNEALTHLDLCQVHLWQLPKGSTQDRCKIASKDVVCASSLAKPVFEVFGRAAWISGCQSNVGCSERLVCERLQPCRTISRTS